ncbi:MAG: bifunctional folylpolyglutamate synthase/dihydrofolate synthase, partial [Oscillospiraceae bacterium]|nr:bifunctional folylpolyglutamate synthase/dihydrofolate synthase [Oscillospiraceae bacterium]
MTAQEAKQYLLYGPWPGHPHSLAPIRALMNALGNPQAGLKCVHVAGTNGKGSACAMLESILRAAGYKTGLYTSPHLQDFSERIRVNGKKVSGAALVRAAERVRAVAGQIGEPLTAFDAITAAAFLVFAEANCEIVVLEVGLGGTWDATNVIDQSECSLIMNLGLDHTALLGDTVEQIAAEKAGILKPGGAAALYPPPTDAAEDLIAGRCRELGVSLRLADFDELETLDDSPAGQVFCYCDDTPLSIPLMGDHQLRNAAVVLEAVELLRERGWRISDRALESGLASTVWPARMEIAGTEPWFVIDGGHNPQCAVALAENWAYYWPEGRRVLLVGMMADKDVEGFLRPLAPLADAIVCTAPAGSRAMTPEALGALARPYKKPVLLCSTAQEAAETAKRAAGRDGCVLGCGSLYLAGELREVLGLEEGL